MAAFPCHQQIGRQFCFLSPLDEHCRLLPDLHASVVLESHDFTALPTVHHLANMLTAQYGGYPANWAITPVNAALLLRVPDWISAEELLLDADYWDHTHYLKILPWQHLSTAVPLPELTKVRVTLRNFPIDFFHPHYYRQATASMGVMTGVDRDCLRGSHRSYVRLFLDCPDLRLIPHILVVGHNGAWTECPVELEMRGALPGAPQPPAPPPPPNPLPPGQNQQLLELLALAEAPGWQDLLQQRVPFLRDPLTEAAPAAAMEKGDRFIEQTHGPSSCGGSLESTSLECSQNDNESAISEKQSRPVYAGLLTWSLQDTFLNDTCHKERVALLLNL